MNELKEKEIVANEEHEVKHAPKEEIDFGIDRTLVEKEKAKPFFIEVMADFEEASNTGVDVFTATREVYRFLFGKEKTTEILKHFQTHEELNDFLGKYKD